ncbi:MAG: cytochrome c biogenesis protein CcdA [Ktedonobacterales bacterium]|nr:cytochrome c biogenesis protein CcdA [Ktedonobacterales bacterium]
MGNLNIFIAFVAGLASFLSPCVLPLVPSYLAQLVGPGVLEAQMDAQPAMQVRTDGSATLGLTQRRPALCHSFAFVGGFSTAFIALGASASVLGGFLKSHQQGISEVGGLIMIVLGLHFAGIIKIPLLYREGRLTWRPTQRGYGASFLIGLIFALGWTPCIGVILTGILVLAAQSTTLGAGIILLAAYSVGLGVPFIIMGAAFSQSRRFLKRLTPHLGTIERVTGIVIALMGFLIFNGWLIYLNHYFTFGLPGL